MEWSYIIFAEGYELCQVPKNQKSRAVWLCVFQVTSVNWKPWTAQESVFWCPETKNPNRTVVFFSGLRKWKIEPEGCGFSGGRNLTIQTVQLCFFQVPESSKQNTTLRLSFFLGTQNRKIKKPTVVEKSTTVIRKNEYEIPLVYCTCMSFVWLFEGSNEYSLCRLNRR